jgi:peptide chain release factor 1
MTPTISDERIAAIEARRETLQGQLSAGDLATDRLIALSKEYSDLEPVAKSAAELRRLRAEFIVMGEMLKDADPEIREMAEEELQDIREALPAAERDLALKLLPKDAADERAAMLEIRAGTGGDEAALFAGDLYRMYQRYAEVRGWKVEQISASEADVGGYKEVVASVTGQGVFARLKFESGVHRVQRGASIRRRRRSRCCPRPRMSMSRSTMPICGSMFIVARGRAGSRSIQQTAPCGSRICLRGWS